MSDLLSRPEAPANDDVSAEDWAAGKYSGRSVKVSARGPKKSSVDLIQVAAAFGLMAFILAVAIPSLGSFLWNGLGEVMRGMRFWY